jgi:hypothetical protein
MTANHIRVAVHRRPGSDAVLAGRLRALRPGPAALLAGALLVLTGVVMIVGLLAGAEGDEVETVAMVIGTLGLIAALSAWLFHRQTRRAAGVPGRLWLSPPALYPGPYDQDGPGLAGSTPFARRHAGGAAAPVVRLVLTPTALLVVPTRGPNRPLTVALAEIATIDVTFAGRTDSGITVTTGDGRVATFVARPHERLIGVLQRLGATATDGP